MVRGTKKNLFCQIYFVILHKKHFIQDLVRTAREYVAEFFEELERSTGYRPQEFQAHALRRRLRQTLNDLYRLNNGRLLFQHIISICRFIVRIYHGEEEFDLERSVGIFVDVLSQFVMGLKSMFLLNCALFLMDSIDQNHLEYIIGVLFYVFDFLCNKLIIKSADMLKIWLPIILRSCYNLTTDMSARFSDMLFVNRAMIAA